MSASVSAPLPPTGTEGESPALPPRAARPCATEISWRRRRPQGGWPAPTGRRRAGSSGRPQPAEQRAQGPQVDGLLEVPRDIEAANGGKTPGLSAQPTVLAADDDEMAAEAQVLELGHKGDAIAFR